MRNLRPIDLCAASLVAAVVLIGFNAAVARAARRLAPQQLLQRIDATASNARFVFLGDSQMEADADPVSFSAGCARPKDWRPSINVGLGGTKASEHCLILEHLLTHAPAADTVFYGFYDNLVTEPVPARFQDLGGNRALAFAFPERAAELLCGNDPIRRWTFRTVARVPMIAQRVGIWDRVERARRILAAIGLPPVAESRFGRIADFNAIEPPAPSVFEAELDAALREQRPLNFSTQEILRVCGARRVKLHLIAMPVPGGHRSKFYSMAAWAAYREHVSSLVRAGGGGFIDASDWLNDEHFEDPLHATVTGARLFSARLAQEVCQTADAAAQR